MLNRLMFVYFIQRKGFLDGDRDYLRNRLDRMRAEHGRDKFYSFYRYFLLRLFHEGLGGRERSPKLENLVGRIPYLNGGLFDIHELELPDRYGKSIEIPDSAFERVFDYFDQYQWHLDERPLRADNEINPDVLGYIFEKYINQKQMGAYHTKEDITEYIGKSTVLPFLFDAARAKCKIAFENPNGPTIWDLLRSDPDRYIYAAVRHGTDAPLPPDIAAGIDPPTLCEPVGDGPSDTLELRKAWNRAAPPEFALPTETWREVIARRNCYEEVRAKHAAGEVRDINDLITLNLDIRQFAQDAIENCEGPELLRAFWHAIEKVTVLDPTCGSGAFLFAALNILEPLYEACLERMEAFVEDLSRSGEKARPEKFADFRKVLASVAAHPNRRYFIFKSIILNNLFGVDIMEKAVEICKLRLFLKLAAQVEPDLAAGNLGIEPLPDIDFNIRAGNTLVGYATYDEVKKAITSKLDLDNAMEKIAVKAADLQQTFDTFRQRQTEGDGSVPSEHKQELRRRLKALVDELNRHLAREYGLRPGDKAAYAKWVTSHQPFHWFVEFYGIMSGGGFDVIIGNPPWVEYAKVKHDYAVKGYQTAKCGNLHAMCTERGLQIRSPLGSMSFIVQLPMVNSSRMLAVRKVLRQSSTILYVIPFGDRPGRLFVGLEHSRATIWLSSHQKKVNGENARFHTSRYQRWPTEGRPFLFHTLEYARTNGAGDLPLYQDQFPKYANKLAILVFQRMKERGDHTISEFLSRRQTCASVFYQEATEYWVKATVGLPYYAKNGKVGAPAHGRYLYQANEDAALWTCALMHSSLFFVYFVAHSDCFHLSDSLVRGFQVPKSLVGEKKLVELGSRLMDALRGGAERKIIQTRGGGDKIAYDEYYGWKAKPTIDRIDALLAKHYGFTYEELDFIVNYDIKYRLGGSSEAGEEE